MPSPARLLLDNFCAQLHPFGLSPSLSPDPPTEPRTRQERARAESVSPSRRAPTLSGEFQFPGDVWDSEREGMRVLLFSAHQELERAFKLCDVLFW